MPAVTMSAGVQRMLHCIVMNLPTFMSKTAFISSGWVGGGSGAGDETGSDDMTGLVLQGGAKVGAGVAAHALLARISRISVSSTSSLVGGAGAGGSLAALRRRRLMPFTTRKRISAMIRKLITTVMKWP